jgi:hypothetical protein
LGVCACPQACANPEGVLHQHRADDQVSDKYLLITPTVLLLAFHLPFVPFAILL